MEEKTSKYDKAFLVRSMIMIFVIVNLILVMFMAIGVAYGDWSGLIVVNIVLTAVALVLLWDVRRLVARVCKAILDDDGSIRPEVEGTLRALRQVIIEWISEVKK
jgi:hypothetical protein